MEIKSIYSDSTKIQIGKVNLELNELKTEYRNREYKKNILVEINEKQKSILILFKLIDDEEISERQIYLAKETGMMFFMTDNQYGIIDLNKIEILEHKKSFTFGFPERIKKSVIFDDEISAKSYSIGGKFISEIPIDPPSERKIFENYLEFESPIFGKRKLKIE